MVGQGKQRSKCGGKVEAMAECERLGMWKGGMGKESIVRIVEEVGKCGDEAQVGSRDQEIISLVRESWWKWA